MKHTFDNGTKEKRLVWLNANPEPQPRSFNEREESKAPPEAQKSAEKKDVSAKPTDTRGIGNWVYENTVGAGKRANEQMQGAVDATIKFGKDAGAGAMQQINGTFESIGTKAAEARNAVLSKVGGNIKKSATETWESAKATAGKARELGKSAMDSAKGKINEFNTKANADKSKTEASKAPAPKPTDAPKPKTETPAAGKTEKPAAPKPGTEAPKSNPKDAPKATAPEAGKPAPAAAAEGQKEGDPKTNKDSLEKSMKDFSNKLKEAKTPEEKMTAFLGLLTALIAYMHSSMHGELDKPVEKKTDAAGKNPDKTADEKKAEKAEDRVQKEVEAGTKPQTVAEMKKKTADLNEKKTAEKKSNTELIDGYDKDTKAKTEENKSLETKRSELNGKQNLLPATATEAEKTQITNAIKEIDDKIGVNKKAIETAKGEKTKLLDRNKVLDEDLGVLDKQEKTLNSSVSKIKSLLEEAKDNLKIDGVKNNIDWKDVYLKIDGTIVIEQPNDPFMTFINKFSKDLKKDEEGKLMLKPEQLPALIKSITEKR